MDANFDWFTPVVDQESREGSQVSFDADGLDVLAVSYTPDGLELAAVEALVAQVSVEIAAGHEPTSALVDGSARVRRNLRILARAVNGEVARYGVSLAQAVRELEDEFPNLTVAHRPVTSVRVAAVGRVA